MSFVTNKVVLFDYIFGGGNKYTNKIRDDIVACDVVVDGLTEDYTKSVRDDIVACDDVVVAGREEVYASNSYMGL